MTREQRSLQIEQSFDSMMAVVEAALTPNNTIKSLCISGAPGIGKTYSLSKRLEQAHANLDWNVTSVSGKMTTLALYELLYNNRHCTSCLVLDDMDSVFESEDSLNLLKAALDSSKRTVSYLSSSKYLKDLGIPRTFEMNGLVIFITNKNLSAAAKAGTKMAPHYSALMSRSVYVDLKIYNNTDIMIHINNVMTKTNILESYGVNWNGSNMILNWMLKNEEALRLPSLRTPVLISSLYHKYPYDWEDKCNSLFLEK